MLWEGAIAPVAHGLPNEHPDHGGDLSGEAAQAAGVLTPMPPSEEGSRVTFADLPVISRLSQRLLEANSFTPELEQAYLELIQAITRDLRPLPGTNTIVQAFAERFAHHHVWLKQRDLMGREDRDADGPVREPGKLGYVPDYERISNLHLKYGALMLKHAGNVAMEESHKRALAYEVTQAVLEAIDLSKEIDPNDRALIKSALAERIRGLDL